MNDLLPPNLDRRKNGRCRAHWIAYDRCPGSLNPWNYAIKNYEKFLDEAIKLDENGMLPCCKPQKWDKPKKLKPIRERVRKRK